MPRIRTVILIQILILTAGFALAYGIIRSIPVKACDILHYGQFMNEAGEVEFCGAGEVEFFDMRELRYPVIATLTPADAIAPGQEARFRLKLVDYAGTPLSADDIAISHTERIHLMAVDAALEDYRHLHPVATDAPGEFEFALTPARTGRYAVYLDFIPIRSGRRVLLATGFDSGDPSPTPATPAFPGSHAATVDGWRLTLQGAEAPLPEGELAQLRLRVARPGGGPATLEPVMGAWAHLVAFDAGHRGFAHLHPLTPYIKGQTLRSPDVLDFSFVPDRPGDFRLWAQVQIEGRDVFAPFDLKVVERVEGLTLR